MKKQHVLPFIIFLLFLFAVAPAVKGNEVPFVPTPENVVEEMLAMGEVSAIDNLIDLGSGDGRIVITAAKRHRANATGIEYNNDLVLKSRENAIKEGVADKATFLHEDLYLADISGATIITMYLLPDVNLKLRPRILQLAPGTRIVSHDFDMDEWEPDAKKLINPPEKSYGRHSQVYLWIVPANVDGRWVGTISGPDGEKPVELEFDQKFQKASIKGTVAGKKMVGSCNLRGDALSLLLEPSAKKQKIQPSQFDLRIKGNEIEGKGQDGKKRQVTLRVKRSAS